MAIDNLVRKGIPAADALIQIVELPGVYFTKYSGGEKSFSRLKVSDGQTGRMHTVAGGRYEISDITLSKPRSSNEAQTLAFFQSLQNGDRAVTITVTPIARSLDESSGFRDTPLGAKVTYSGCILKSFRALTDADTSDANNAFEITATFAVDDMRFV